MQMNNMPLQSLARLTCGFGVTDLREALEGRSNTSDSAIAWPPSISTLEIYPLRSKKSWISNRTGASIMIISMFQLIYLKIDLSTLPIFSTLYLLPDSMDVK